MESSRRLYRLSVLPPIRTDLLVNAPCNRLSRKLYAGNPHVRFDEKENSSRTLSTLLRDSLIFLEPRAPSIAQSELEQRLRRTMGALPNFIVCRRFAQAHQ